MQGLMQRHELLISSILEHADRHHGDGDVVSRRADGSLARTSYGALAKRARKLATVLGALGVKPGDRVGTLAMNSDRHVELYYAISGTGAVCHTINPRLSHDDVGYIMEHAQDGLVFCDAAFAPIIAAVAPGLKGILRGVVVLADPADMPTVALPAGVALHCYETLLAEAEERAAWPLFDENAASALCYTSGTTGRPKGVLYSHRSTLLHTMVNLAPDALGARATDRILAVVPMFHVNAWGLPYLAPMAGAALLLPGRQLDPASLVALMNDERATLAVGVPTIWLGLLNHLRDTGGKLETLKRVFVGGAALPRAMITEFARHGIEARQGWGMTESSPVVTVNAPKPSCLRLETEARLYRRAKQGRCLFGVDVRAQGEDGAETPLGTPGDIVFRGHWIASGYYRMPPSEGAWFPTGDVGMIDDQGFVLLTDRSKDLIKSGGEWISSIAIENIAMEHPDVAEAAAIAVPHAKWGERPLLIVVPRPGCTPAPEVLREFCRGKMPDWSIPDSVVIADSIPHGATGKVLKAELRRIYAAG